MSRGLRKSQQIFSGQFGVPAEQNYYAWVSQKYGVDLPLPSKALSWNPTSQSSNCPNVCAVVKHYIRHCPWQIRSVLKSTFVGRVDRITPNAAALGAFGEQPCIAIFDGLYSAIDQCISLWEKVHRAYAVMLQQRGIEGRSDEEVKMMVTRELERRDVVDNVEKIHRLRNFLLSGDPDHVRMYAPSAFELKEDGVPRIDLGHRSARFQITECFVIAHELAHVLLGHCSPDVVPPTAANFLSDELLRVSEFAQLDGFDSQSRNDEMQADLVGFYTLVFDSNLRYTLEFGPHRDFGRDKAYMSILIQCLDGAAIACLAIHLVSTLGIPPTSDSSHPHPDERVETLLRVTQGIIDAKISQTRETDIGPNGPGFFDRITWAPFQTNVVYEICKRILEF